MGVRYLPLQRDRVLFDRITAVNYDAMWPVWYTDRSEDQEGHDDHHATIRRDP